MALVTTNCAAAVDILDTTITVASASSIAPGRLIKVDDEFMIVAKSYVTAMGTSVPVLRGRNGTLNATHVFRARATHGDAADFGIGNAQVPVSYALAGRAKRVTSYTATGTITPPIPGEDLVVILNTTGSMTMTLAAPDQTMDGCEITFAASLGSGTHVVVFTGGLNGAGSGYTTVTLNTGNGAAFKVVAINGLWMAMFAPAMGGTVTNLIGTLS